MRQEVQCLNCWNPLHQMSSNCPNCGISTQNDYPQLPYGNFLLDGRYQIGNVLGQGGFGITYKVYDRHSRKINALKEFFPVDMVSRHPQTYDVEPRLERFESHGDQIYEATQQKFLGEAQALTSFTSPNIVSVDNYFQTYNTAYIALEYIDGPTLQEYIEYYQVTEECLESLKSTEIPQNMIISLSHLLNQPFQNKSKFLAALHSIGIDSHPSFLEEEILPKVLQYRTLSEAEALGRITPIVQALRLVHQEKILHRDIKPENIIIKSDGISVLIDFGTVRQDWGKASRSLLSMLTPPFAPPEQHTTSMPQGPYTDIYALGATLYTCLMGNTKLPQSTDIQAGNATIIWPTHVSPTTLELLKRSLEPNYRQRLQTIEEFEAVLNPVSPPDPPPSDQTLEIHAGRGRHNELIFNENIVSTNHARLFYQSGQWFVEDTRSTNGTFLNGKKLASLRRYMFDPIRDQLMLGSITLDPDKLLPLKKAFDNYHKKMKGSTQNTDTHAKGISEGGILQEQNPLIHEPLVISSDVPLANNLTIEKNKIQETPAAEVFENTSGQGKSTIVPSQIKKWNWGAFFLNWIWGIGNNTYIALLGLIPVVGFVMMVVLGLRGSEWAWQNKRWESIEHFQRVQRKWAQWGLGLFVAGITLYFINMSYVLHQFSQL